MSDAIIETILIDSSTRRDLIAYLVFFGGLLLVGYGSELKRGLSIWRTDPVSVFEAGNADGTVELEGSAVQTHGQFDSPFTETPCLAAEYVIEEYRSTNNGSSWRTIHSGGDGVPFRLEDDSGGILVDPENATISLTDNEAVQTVDRGSTADEPIASFLETIDIDPGSDTKRSIGPIDIESGDKRRYTERRLHSGDAAHVHGPIERNPPISTRESDFNAAIRDGTGTAEFYLSDGDESDALNRSEFRLSVLGVGLVSLALGLLVVELVTMIL